MSTTQDNDKEQNTVVGVLLTLIILFAIALATGFGLYKSGVFGGKDGAVVVVGPRLPCRLPRREQEARAGGMQIVDRGQQPRHRTRFKDQTVKAAIRFLPFADIARGVARPRRILGRVQNRRGQMRGSMAQRQNLKRGAHGGDLLDLVQIKARHPDTLARLADRQPLRLEPAERLAHGDVAGAEFLGDMVLTQPGPRLDLAGDDAIGQHAADAMGKSVFGSAGHFYR